MKKTVHEHILHSNAANHWKKIGIKNRIGVCVPLFSLRSKHSTGIGEFLDLIVLIDFCKKTSMDILQILPINDTGNHVSPYSALSAMALNPIYLSLAKLKNVKQDPRLKGWIHQLREIDQSTSFDYFEVLQIKMDFLKHYFRKKKLWIGYKKQIETFVNENAWVDDYALFCILKRKYEDVAWYDWPKSLQKLTPAKKKKLLKEHRADIAFYRFLQFLCFDQMKVVKHAAKKADILIKGDIPILVSKDSVDVWMHQDCFFLNKVAGAPPDTFNPKGQNWGFPIYNWPVMEKRGFLWWQQRLKVAASMYDVYRIDHAVGFFRIWSVGKNGDPKFGGFVPKDPDTWVDHGKKHMQMLLNSSDLLPIAEDLGKVPIEVRKALVTMGICGTKVVKSQYHWTKKHFILTEAEYPEISMTTLGTHDMRPLALWWKDYPKIAKHFAKYFGWEYQPKFDRNMLYRFLKFSHQTKSLFHISMLDEYLALDEEFTIHPIEKRRVNVPGTISKDNWAFRMKGKLEDVIDHAKLVKKIKKICV